MKKVLIMMMCVIMVVCFMPTVAMADEYNMSEEEFNAAISSAESGTTVTLTGNVTLGSACDIDLEEKAITLDLGGYTLSGRLNIRNGSLTVKNGIISGVQPLNVYGSSETGKENYSVFTLEKTATVNTNGWGLILWNTSPSKYTSGITINIHGTINADNASAIFVQGNTNTGENNIINICEGASITGDSPIAINGDADVHVYGGTITGTEYAIGVKNGSLNVHGGSLICTGEAHNPGDANFSGTEATGAAISVSSTYDKLNSAPLSVTVSGGEIKSTNGESILVYKSKKTDSSLIEFEQTPSVEITGGTFSDLGVLEYAQDNANIALSGDVSVNNKIEINKPVTIDGNGHTIRANEEIDDHLLLITANATVKNVKLDSAKKVKGVHVYSSSADVSASFDGVTFANSKGSGLTVNGTTVSLKDVAFTENAWQDVNVDSGVGVTNDSILNIGTGCTFSHELQITSDGQKGDDGRYGGKYGTVTLNDSAKTLAEKTVDVPAKDSSSVDYTYQKKVWTISDKPYIPPYVPTSPTTPTDNVTNSGSTTTDNASTNADLSNTTSTSNGTTTATVDKTTADKIVDKAVENKSTEVVIDATANTTTAADSTTIAQVTIPTETLGAIAEKTEADVTIKTDVAEVKMDNAAATAVSEQATGETVQIIAEKVAEEADKVEFELKVVCSDGKVISNFNGGNIAVTVVVPKAMADKKLVCVYIDDNGHMSKVEGQKNADGTYTFVTGHFSSYAILAEEEADAAIAAQKEAIKNIKIKLSSKQVKTKAGKKAVKIAWTADAGDKVLDGVEVFRSTERYKGYGTEPFYTSTKGGNEGYYLNTKSLKKGNKYYYRVRGYVLVNGEKVYTDYSTKAWRTVK